MSHPGLRIFAGLAAGVVVAIALIAIVTSLGDALFPPPEGLGLTTAVTGQRAELPVAFGARLIVIAAWALATYAGGAVAARIVGRRWAVWPIAVLVVSATTESIAGFTHPTWMIVVGLLLPWPCAWAAARFARHA